MRSPTIWDLRWLNFPWNKVSFICHTVNSFQQNSKLSVPFFIPPDLWSNGWNRAFCKDAGYHQTVWRDQYYALWYQSKWEFGEKAQLFSVFVQCAIIDWCCFFLSVETRGIFQSCAKDHTRVFGCAHADFHLQEKERKGISLRENSFRLSKWMIHLLLHLVNPLLRTWPHLSNTQHLTFWSTRW